MIKKIKFFIRIGGIPCRTLEDLQNNFYLQDVITIYKDGVLTRWLFSNNYEELAEKTATLPTDLDYEPLAKELVAILNPHTTDDAITNAIHYFHFTKTQRERDRLSTEAKGNWRSLAMNYHAGYASTLIDISKNRDNFDFLCMAAADLVDNYWGLVETNMGYFHTTMLENAPCIFFPLIAMGKFRTNSISDRTLRENFAAHIDAAFKECKVNEDPIWYKKISKSLSDYPAPNKNFFIVNKSIDSWDDLVQDESRKIMAIYTRTSTVSARSTRTREEYKFKDIYKNFPMFMGLDYKDNGNAPFFAYIDFPDSIRDRCVINNNEDKDTQANEQTKHDDTSIDDLFSKNSMLYRSVAASSTMKSEDIYDYIDINENLKKKEHR